MLIIIELIINILYFFTALEIPGKFKVFSNEMSRKISHILCGNWIFFFAFFNRYYFIDFFIILLMIFIMILSYKYNIFKGVERPNQIKSFGTIYFFLSLLILVIITKARKFNKSIIIMYYLPFVYGDAFAAIIGKKFDWVEYKIWNNKKTLSGNIGMFLTSLLALYLYNSIILKGMYSYTYILIISILDTLIEAVSIKGIDNFTIPIINMLICEVLL